MIVQFRRKLCFYISISLWLLVMASFFVRTEQDLC